MKTMRKGIVVKMLTGVTVAALTVAGVAVPMAVNSAQNPAEVPVIADEDVLTAEMFADAERTGDETNIAEEADAAEELMTNPEYPADDGQRSDMPMLVQAIC